MNNQLARNGKSQWAEKSVRSVDHAELIAATFPDAKFVCLYRNCLDVIASALEATKYQFLNYGFDRYVQSRLDNIPAAFAEYWVDKTQLIYEFEKKHPERCTRVRYEDVVGDPGSEIKRLLESLRLPWFPAIVTEVFSAPHTIGPGDHKILETSRFETSSVGRGADLPVEMLVRQIERINLLSETLGYPLLELESD